MSNKIFDTLIKKSLSCPLVGQLQFYDNLTGKLVENTQNNLNGLHGFVYCNSKAVQINFVYDKYKYVCRSLWYTDVKLAITHYPISKYYCVFFTNTIIVLSYDDMLLLDQSTCGYYITPMITYDTFTFNNTITIDQMYLVDQRAFSVVPCGIQLNDFSVSESNQTPMILSNYGSCDQNDRCVDKTIRNSTVSVDTFIVDIDLNNCINNINCDVVDKTRSVFVPCDKIEYIEYSNGQHFSIHIDRKRNPSHTHTILIYPPTINEVDGGELVLYPYGSISPISITIKMSPTKWVGVIFPIDIEHESIKINSTGKIKKLLKTTGSILNIFNLQLNPSIF